MPEPTVWLLLVGIDFYPDKEYQLHGAVNDVVDLELSLKERYKETNVTKLVAPVPSDLGPASFPEPRDLPTWENFTAALKNITQKATKGDIVWVHYSGHGTLKPTTDPGFTYRENYGIDAALVLLEPEAQQGIRYLRGLELAPLLEDMVDKELRLTVVLDSCHSGSISRGENRMIRGLPWSIDIDSEFPLQPRSSGSLTLRKGILRNAQITDHWLLYPQRYALLAACGPHEVVREIRVGERRCHGAFSYYMLEALQFCAQNQIQDVTHELIHRHICAKISNVPDQHPILLGAEGTTLSGARAAHLNRSSSFEVVKVSSDQEIWLNSGLIHGARIGDEYIVRPYAEATDFVTRIIITDVQAAHSIAKQSPFIALGESLRIKVGDCANLAALAQPRAHIKAFPGADRAWKERLDKSLWLRCLLPNEPTPINIPCFSIEIDGQTYTILDSQDSQIPNLPPIVSSGPQVSDQMLPVLEHLCKSTFVRDLDNHGDDILLDSDFSITIKPRTSYLSTLESDDYVTVPHDSKVDITFQNRTQEILYFAVLNLTPLQRVKLLRIRGQEYQTVMPHDPQKVLPREMPDIRPPGEVQLALRMNVPEQLKAQQSDCVSVEDVLKFFVSTSPVRSMETMQLPSLWNIVESDAVAMDSGDEAFGVLAQESLLDQSKASKCTRGETKKARWVCRSIMVRTVLKMG